MVDVLPQSELLAGMVPSLDEPGSRVVSAAEELSILDPFVIDAPAGESTPAEGDPQLPAAGAAAAPRQESSNILKMKGLPYATTEESVLEFFQGFQIQRVAFVYEPDGRPSGLAFAEFESKEEALKALSKNGEYIGERYVRLLHVPKTEMDEQVRLGTLAIPGAAAKLRTRLMRAQQRTNNVAYLGNPLQLAPPLMSPSARPQQGQNGGGGFAGQDPRNWPAGFVPPGQYGGARPYGQQQQGQYLGQGYNGLPMGMYPGQGLPAAFPGQQGGGAGNYPGQPGGQQAGGGYAQGGYPGGAPSGGGGYPQQLPATLAAQFGALGLSGGGPAGNMPRNGSGGFLPGSLGPATAGGTPSALNGARAPGGGGAAQAPSAAPSSSATLKIRGLPYRSSPAEILAFFGSYHFLPDSLQIGLDSLARPSGEAWLTFAAPSEALRAVRDLNRHYLQSRYLELSVC